MLTLTNVYQRMLKLPEGDTRERLAQVYGYLRNEIALLSGKSQPDVQQTFERIAAQDK